MGHACGCWHERNGFPSQSSCLMLAAFHVPSRIGAWKRPGGSWPDVDAFGGAITVSRTSLSCALTLRWSCALVAHFSFEPIARLLFSQ
jgi:hypothetical protein